MIELFKKNQNIISEIKTIGIENITISTISIYEMYVGALNKRELNTIKKFLGKFSQTTLSERSLKIAEDLLFKYRLSHGLFINDALIAATALDCNYQVYTLNIKDFKFIPKLMLYKP